MPKFLPSAPDHSQMTIPFLNLRPMHSAIKNEIVAAFNDVYDDNWFVLGDRLRAFESEYALFNGTNFALGVSNGLDALFLSLKALGIGTGDEVIVPSNTYIATALAVSYLGAKPIFVEPHAITYNIDPLNIEPALSGRTKAIIPVHLYGQACDMANIMRIAASHNLFVIEDNAQAHGATFKGKMTGSFGHVNGTSFYPGKNLGALGDGGAITTDDEAIFRLVNLYRNYGSEAKYEHKLLGHNMRLDEIQAAFLSIKLKYLSAWTSERQKIAGWYDLTLQGVGDLELPKRHEDSTHVYHLYVVRTRRRDDLQRYLTTHGIGTLVHYPLPPHLQPAYAFLRHRRGSFPIAEMLADTSISLPVWPGMSLEDVEQISTTIRLYFMKG